MHGPVTIGPLIGVLSALFLLSALYAILLTWLEREFGFVTDYTWLTVVVGVGFTLVGLAILSVDAALLALAAFCATGIPIILRALILDMQQRKALRDHLAGKGES